MNRTIIKCNNILLGENLELVNNKVLIIDEGKIIDILPIDSLKKYDSDNILDFGDYYLMPGFIDCHNHLALDARIENHLVKMNDCEAEQSIRAVKTMHDDLKAGVTTSRCLGDKYYIDITFKKAQKEGRVIGPRLIVSGIGMRSSHGHGFVGMPFVGEQEFRKQARENILRGADLLKVFTTKVINATPFIPFFLTLKELQTVVEEANSVNIPTACHVSGGVGLDRCIQAGISTLEHVYYITEQQIEKVKNSNSWVVYTPSYALDDNLLLKFSPKNYDESMKEKEIITKCLEKAIKAGLKFGIGTDGLHGGLIKEVEYISALGASNKDVLKGITVNAGKLCNNSNIGTIEKEKFADFVVLKDNPLDDIKNLKNIISVIQNGKIVDL